MKFEVHRNFEWGTEAFEGVVIWQRDVGISQMGANIIRKGVNIAQGDSITWLDMHHLHH